LIAMAERQLVVETLTQTDAVGADAEAMHLRRLRLRVGIALGLIVGALVLWSALAPVRGAVIAPGVVKTERDRKTVRHQEGGIVREVLVREGQRVKAGDALLVIGDVRTEALLDLYQDQWVSESVRHARLEAEVALATRFDLDGPVAEKASAKGYLRRERQLFDARRRTLVEQQQSFEQQFVATASQIDALTAQVETITQGGRMAREELALNQDLVREGFVQRTRVLALERAVSDYDSRRQEQSSELAVARQRLADLQLRAAQARNQYQQQAATELKDSAVRLREIEEQLRPARDMAARQSVRSPVDGEIMALHVAGPGAVVGPREPLLDVVPVNEPLVVEVRVDVADIEHVQVGSEAEVRLSAYEYRAMPLLVGRVTAVSADRMEDERTGLSWFTTRIEVDPADLADYPDVRMRAGMPAEAYLQTEGRSLLEYVLRPMTSFARRGMREP
jgi:HlyD family type I secretion membrane fusion protein